MQTTKQQWSALFEAALARREQEEKESRQREWSEFFAELYEKGKRLLAPPPPKAIGLPSVAVMTELAEEVTRAAPDWERVDQLRIPFNLSAYEALGLVMTVDPDAAIRLFCEFPRASP